MKRTTVAITATSLVLAALIVVAGSPANAGADKVDICHWSEEDGAYIQISVAGVAADRHLSQHAEDLAVGGAVSAQCEQAVTVFARAYSVSEAGEEVLIAQVEDTNGSGTPDPGDIVRTNSYPLDASATAFGDFSVTEHAIKRVDIASPGSLSVFSLDGSNFWFVLDTAGGERWTETDFATRGRTLLSDDAGGAYPPNIIVDPSSPSRPAHRLGLAGPRNGLDDGYLEIEFSLLS